MAAFKAHGRAMLGLMLCGVWIATFVSAQDEPTTTLTTLQPSPQPTTTKAAPPPRTTCPADTGVTPTGCGEVFSSAIVFTPGGSPEQLYLSQQQRNASSCELPSVTYDQMTTTSGDGGDAAYGIVVTFATVYQLDTAKAALTSMPAGVKELTVPKAQGQQATSFTIRYTADGVLPRRLTTITVSLTAESFVCPGIVPPPITLRILPLESPISVGLIQAVSGLATTTAVLASAGGSPTMAMQQNKMSAVSLGANCGSSPMDEEPLSAADSPTGMGFGDVEGYYVRGAIVGNLILFFGLNAFFLLILGVLLWVRWDETKDPTNPVTPQALTIRALADIHFPSILVVPVGVCYQSTVRASFAMFYYAETHGDKFLGAFGFMVAMAFTAVVIYHCAYRFRATLIVREPDSDEEEGATGPHPVMACLDWWMEPDTKWVGPADDPHWKHRYMMFFADYTHGYFFAVELGMAAILGIIDAIGPETESGCVAKFVITFLLIIVFALVFAWLRPFTCRLAVHYTMMMNAITVFTAILGLANAVNYSPDTEAASAVFGMFALVLGMAKFFLDLWIGFYTVFQRRHSILRSVGGLVKGNRWGKALDVHLSACAEKCGAAMAALGAVASKLPGAAKPKSARDVAMASGGGGGATSGKADPLAESLLVGHPPAEEPSLKKKGGAKGAHHVAVDMGTMTDPVVILSPAPAVGFPSPPRTVVAHDDGHDDLLGHPTQAAPSPVAATVASPQADVRDVEPYAASPVTGVPTETHETAPRERSASESSDAHISDLLIGGGGGAGMRLPVVDDQDI
jgi:hypothetical protein